MLINDFLTSALLIIGLRNFVKILRLRMFQQEGPGDTISLLTGLAAEKPLGARGCPVQEGRGKEAPGAPAGLREPAWQCGDRVGTQTADSNHQTTCFQLQEERTETCFYWPIVNLPNSMNDSI